MRFTSLFYRRKCQGSLSLWEGALVSRTSAVILSLGVLGAMAVSLTGCATSVRDNVPATEIKGSLRGVPVSFTGPKDFKADLIKFSVDTNGTIAVEVRNIDCRMNPENIVMTGSAYQKMREADTAHDVQMLKAAGETGGTIGSQLLK